MGAGGADDEDQFRKRAVIYEKRTALNMDMVKYEESIKRFSSALGEIERVAEELSKTDLEKLEGQRIRLEKELKTNGYCQTDIYQIL